MLPPPFGAYPHAPIVRTSFVDDPCLVELEQGRVELSCDITRSYVARQNLAQSEAKMRQVNQRCVRI